MKKLSLPAMLISLLFSGCASRPPLASVPSVDLSRCTGRWHEIAKFLWILAGEPRIPAAACQKILKLIVGRGYDLARIELTPQP